MTLKECAIVLCRSFAVYALYREIQWSHFQIWDFTLSLSTFRDTLVDLFLKGIAADLLLLGLSFVFWFYADRIASRMTEGFGERDLKWHFTVEEFQAVVFSSIGIYFLYMGLTYIPYVLDMVHTWTIQIDLSSRRVMIVESLKMLMLFLLGISLLIGSKGWLYWFNKFRRYGIQ